MSTFLSACPIVNAGAVNGFSYLVLRCSFRVRPTASCAVSCKALSGHNVDIDSLFISHAYIVVYQVRESTGGSPTHGVSDHRRTCLL